MTKTILITGTSSGFGKLAVPLLLERGHRVIAGMRGGEARLETVFPGLAAAHPGRLMSVDLHLDREETFASAVKLVTERFEGHLDVLINNAGAGVFGAVEELTSEQFRYQFEVNFIGQALLTRALLPALRKSRGRIINLSSVAGRMTLPGYSSYCASKYALEALSEGMWFELKPLGVQVALIEPGGFRTEFTRSSRILGDGSKDPASPYRARTLALDRFFEQHDSRLGDPRRVARLIVRLCERRRIGLRYPIGLDAQGARLLALLPDGVRRRLVDWSFRLVVFKR